MTPDRESSHGRALLWLGFLALNGLALLLLYADADQQDSGYHHLFARWSWVHPRYFVNVWARPLFTLIYSLPAQFGYTAAKGLTVAVSLLTGWQTYRLARDLRLDRAELAIPLLLLQPSCYLLFSTVLTEPLFALIFIIALRLHLSGRRAAGALAASTLILVRPEGFFIGLLWGTVLLLENRDARRKLLLPLLLASGMIVWWASALALTSDPLWIAHNWPSDWRVASQANGTGPLWWYFALLPLIVGPFFLPQFIRGLIATFRERVFLFGTASFLTLFLFHSVMYWRGWFGSAGYARYLVCVSPAIAIISLIGWNRFAGREGRRLGWLFVPAAILCICYVDIWPSTRDAIAVDQIYRSYRSRPELSALPVSNLITSQAYMRIIMGFDIGRAPSLTGNRETNLQRIRKAPPGTLIFWESNTGPAWYHLYPQDFIDAGYITLVRSRFELPGRFLKVPNGFYGSPRIQEMGLYYRPDQSTDVSPAGLNN